MNLISAFLFRDFAIEKAYRFNLLIRISDVFFQLSIFYFISRLVPGAEYFPFVFVGLMFSRFFGFFLNIFALNIRQEQHWGTAEAVFLSPWPSFAVLLSSASSKLIFLALEFILYFAAGSIIFGIHFSLSVFSFLPVAAINGFAFAGIGLISGSFIMYFKRGDPFSWLVSNSLDLLSGVYFPLAVLPYILKSVSGILPTTSALNIWREILLNGRYPSAGILLTQSIWALFLFAAGFWCFKFAFNKTRKKGELGSY